MEITTLWRNKMGKKLQSKNWKECNMPDWERIRKEDFSLSGEYIYMNNSSFGATLNNVQFHMDRVKRIFAEGCYILNRYIFDVAMPLSGIRKQMQRIINNSPEDDKPSYVGLTNSVTEGMSLVANSMTFEKGDVILTTDHEHPGGIMMWKLQVERYNSLDVKCLEVPLIVENESEAEWENGLIARFKEYFEKYQVKVLSVSMITFSTGHVLPVKRLCELAKGYGAITVIDAAQAWAVIPINMADVGCDFMVMNGHKYLCGPIGSGFMAMEPKLIEDDSSRSSIKKQLFWPTIVDDHNYPFNENAYTKSGVGPYTNMLPLKYALDYYEKLGPEKIHKRLWNIGNWLREVLSMYPDKIDVITPKSPGLSGSMTCFRMKEKEDNYAKEMVERMSKEYKLHVMYTKDRNTFNVRLSPHYYNTEKELMRMIEVICEIASLDKKQWPPFPG